MTVRFRSPALAMNRPKVWFMATPMYYTYVLQSQKDLDLYIGYSANLKERFEYHKKGWVESTKDRRPLRLIFYEAFFSKEDAQRREKYFKTDKGKKALKLMLRSSRTKHPKPDATASVQGK